MRSHSLDRELGALFFTLYEATRIAGRFAPSIAIVLFVAIGGVTLLLVFDVISLIVGRATTWPMTQAPRSIAGVAILGGYFVWDRFACPERLATLQSLHAGESSSMRTYRRLKVVAFVALLVLCFVVLAGGESAA